MEQVGVGRIRSEGIADGDKQYAGSAPKGLRFSPTTPKTDPKYDRIILRIIPRIKLPEIEVPSVLGVQVTGFLLDIRIAQAFRSPDSNAVILEQWMRMTQDIEVRLGVEEVDFGGGSEGELRWYRESRERK